jgi:hypothetical protein
LDLIGYLGKELLDKEDKILPAAFKIKVIPFTENKSKAKFCFLPYTPSNGKNIKIALMVSKR